LVCPRHTYKATVGPVRLRLEYEAKIELTGGTAGADDDRFARANIDRATALALDSDPEHRARIRRLAIDPGHAVLDEDLDTAAAGRDLERTHHAVGGGAGLLHRPIGPGAAARARPAARGCWA